MRTTWLVPILLCVALAAGTQACGRAFDGPHSDPSFPLRDAHDVDCAACHTTAGDFTGLTSACSSCHEDDRPNNHHEGQDCAGCHQPTSWQADFDHDQFFPTPHHGISACDDCHIGGDTNDFSCTDCHTHSPGATNPRHNEVGGYVYDSDHCYDCHHNGGGGDDD